MLGSELPLHLAMTDHLYYHDSFLYEFDADVVDIATENSRVAVILDRTAFYPTSGGQIFDVGSLVRDEKDIPVIEVTEQDNGQILHWIASGQELERGERIHGSINVDRRRDHMQQHSGQHVLSAAFVELFEMPTVSFHMGAESCSIDLDTKSLSNEQVEKAEGLANEIVTQDRPVTIRFVSQSEAQSLGLRKIPLVEREKLRLIDVQDFDLTACGGTHVSSTGQIGGILLRKIEKVRQGWRVEFVCGKRAVTTARRDYATQAESAALLSSHIWEVPQQVHKVLDEARAARKVSEQLLAELAELHAARLLAETPEREGRKVIVSNFPDRDLTFIKLLAQRITRLGPNTVVLLSATASQPALVFAQSAGQPFEMASLIKKVLAKHGGRGGGSKDMAQGGPANPEGLEVTLRELAADLQQ